MKQLLIKINYVFGRFNALALFFTALIYIALIPFQQGQMLSGAFMVVIMALQLAIYSSPRVIGRIVPVRIIEQQVYKPNINNIHFAYVGLLQVLNAIYVPLGWVALLILVVVLRKWLVYNLEYVFNRKQLLKSSIDYINSYAPKIAVHISGKKGTSYQINQWLPVLEKIDVPLIIIAREIETAFDIDKTNIPIVYARNAEHVEKVLYAGVKTVLYPANPMKNMPLFRHYNISHYFINHGESDKNVNQSQLLLVYDKLLVGGPNAKKRLLDTGIKFRDDQIVYVGRPQAELLLEKKDPGKSISTILYAPTWEGFVENNNYSSIGEFSLPILKQLSKSSYNVLFKPHPFTGLRKKNYKGILKQLKAICAKYGFEYVDPSVSIHSVMNRSDLLITDISSVLTEYLITDKPIILCAPGWISKYSIIDDYPSTAAAYLLEKGTDINDLVSKVDSFDQLSESRHLVRLDIFGSDSYSSLDRFKKIVESSVKR